MKNKCMIPLFTLYFIFNITSIKFENTIILSKKNNKKHHSSLCIGDNRYSIKDDYYKILGFIQIHTDVVFAKENVVRNAKLIEYNTNRSEKDNLNYRQGILIKVMLVILIIWFSLSIYIFIIDRKISKLEKKVDEL